MPWRNARGRILVVDAHDEEREAVRTVLARAGHTLSEATSVAEAWAGLPGPDRPGPDLVVVEVVLPDGSGVELTRRLRADPRFEKLSVVLTSVATRTPDEQAAGLDAGADAYLVHPVAPPLLTSTVGALLRLRSAERELATRHQQIEALLGLGGVALGRRDFRTDAMAGTAHLAEWFGLDASQEPGFEAYLEAIDRADREAVERAFAAARAGQEAQLDFRVSPAGRPSYHVVGSVRPEVLGGEVAGATLTLLDVTSRHNLIAAERALRRTEDRFRALFEAIDEGYCLGEMLLDEDGRPADMVIREVNPRFESATGLADPVGRSLRQMLPELDPQWLATLGRVALGGETLRFERGSGVTGRWWDCFAMPVQPERHLVVVFKDTTDAHEANRELRTSEAQLRNISDQMPMMLWLLDRGGRFVWGNATFSRFFGVKAGELVGDAWMGRLHPDEEEGYVAALRQAQEQGRPFQREARMRRYDGEWRWLESWGQPLNALTGEPAGYLGSSADVTERKVVEQAEAARHARTELLAEVVTRLEQAPDLTGKISEALDVLVPGLADAAVLSLDPTGDRVHARHRGRAGEELVTAKGWRDAPDPHEWWRAALGMEIVSRLPMDVAQDPGFLVLGWADASRAGSQAGHFDFLEDLSRRIGMVLGGARLRESERMVSQRLQKALMPETVAWRPSALTAARYQAASSLMEVGGDWYDTVSWASGELGLVVGDVVGHNLDSATSMGRMRTTTGNQILRGDPDPVAVLGAIEGAAPETEGYFATAVCVVADLDSGLLRYASAGHPPALIISADGSRRRLDQPQHAPLGAVSGRPVAAGTVVLSPGDTLLLYTDGLVERRKGRFEDRLDRLESAAATMVDLAIDDLCDRLVAHMAADRPFEDDVVLAALRYRPVLAAEHRECEAGPQAIAPARQWAGQVLERYGVSDAQAERVQVVLGEALSNVVRHAYGDQGGGRARIEIADHGPYVVVAVEDFGSWRPGYVPEAGFGRGIGIMRALADRFSMNRSYPGTTVLAAFGKAAKDA